MKVTHLKWSNYIESHIARHQVSREEVESVIYGDSLTRRGRGASVYATYGQTDAGRYLVVVLKTYDDAGFVLTAREMDKTERKRFKKRKG